MDGALIMDKLTVRKVASQKVYIIGLNGFKIPVSIGRVERAPTLFDALEEKRCELIRVYERGYEREWILAMIDTLASMQARLC